MIIDGRALADTVLAHAKERAEQLGKTPKVVAYAIAPRVATRSYLSIKTKSAAKAGCEFEVRESLPILTDADAIIVQLPIPNEKEICDSIPAEKDADVLSSTARTAFEQGKGLLPPVVGAIKEIFILYGVVPDGKRAIVIGAGFLVGAPAASWLKQEGVEVEVIEKPVENLGDILRTADIIVSGAGSPHIIKPEMLKEGVVLIDAGTSELAGAVVGDADPLCAKKCSIFTPVPGGIGPLAVAKLFENAVSLVENATKK